MATIDVKDAVGTTVAIEKPLPPGRAAAASSRPVVLSTEDKAVLDALATQGYSAAVSVTRPADTTAYTANDVVGAAAAALTFPSMGPSAGEIMIITAQLEVDVAAVPSGMTTFRLYLYSETPPSALADNAAFDLPAGDRASFLGYIDLGTPVDLGSTLYVETSNINKALKLAGTGLFGYLVTNGGYTPSSAAVKKITLHAKSV